MSLILTDTLSSTYTLPANFVIKGMNFTKRASYSNIAWSDGAKNKGDLKIGSRTLEIEGILQAVDATAFETLRNTIYAWLYKNDLTLTYVTGKYFKVKHISNIQLSFFSGGFLRLAKLSFVCNCEDPYQYYTSLNTDTKVISSSPTSWNITNSAAYPVYPIITLTNAENNTDFIIENTTDSVRSCQYVDIACLNTLVTVIDNKEGTVVMNGANGIVNFSGSFLRLLPGVNAIKYTGFDCTMITTWYNREL